MAAARQRAEGMREAGTSRPNCSLQPGDLLAPSTISQGQRNSVSHVCPCSRTRATVPALPSIHVPGLALAPAGTMG